MRSPQDSVPPSSGRKSTTPMVAILAALQSLEVPLSLTSSAVSDTFAAVEMRSLDLVVAEVLASPDMCDRLRRMTDSGTHTRMMVEPHTLWTASLSEDPAMPPDVIVLIATNGDRQTFRFQVGP